MLRFRVSSGNMLRWLNNACSSIFLYSYCYSISLGRLIKLLNGQRTILRQALTHTLTHTLTKTLTLAHTKTLTVTHTLSHPLTLTLTLTHTKTLTLTLTKTLTLTHTRTLTLTLTHTKTLTLTHTLSHPHNPNTNLYPNLKLGRNIVRTAYTPFNVTHLKCSVLLFYL